MAGAEGSNLCEEDVLSALRLEIPGQRVLDDRLVHGGHGGAHGSSVRHASRRHVRVGDSGKGGDGDELVHGVWSEREWLRGEGGQGDARRQREASERAHGAGHGWCAEVERAACWLARGCGAWMRGVWLGTREAGGSAIDNPSAYCQARANPHSHARSLAAGALSHLGL